MSQVDGGSERDATGLLQLEVNVGRTLVQTDTDTLLELKENFASKMVYKITIAVNAKTVYIFNLSNSRIELEI